LPARRFGFLSGKGRFQRQFCGINDFQVVDSAKAEFFAYHLRQGADGCFVYIRDFERRGVEFISGAHAADDPDAGLFAPDDDLDFSRYGVDGVDDVIVDGKIDFARGLRREEYRKGVDNRGRVNVRDTVPCGVDLVSADGFMRRDNLPVQVCQADFIVVEKVQRPDAASCQGFDSIPADAADAENGDARPKQLFHPVFAEKKL